MSAQRLLVVAVLCLVAVACGGESGVDTAAPPTTVEVATTGATAPDTGSITDLEALAGTWYLSGPTTSAMHFTPEGEWWWAKGSLALELKMEREPDGHVAFDDGELVFVDDDVCNGEDHAYVVSMSTEGIDFVGTDGCLRRSRWLSPPAGDTTWNLADDE